MHTWTEQNRYLASAMASLSSLALLKSLAYIIMHWISHEMSWLLHGKITRWCILHDTVSEMLVSRLVGVKRNVSESVWASQGSSQFTTTLRVVLTKQLRMCRYIASDEEMVQMQTVWPTEQRSALEQTQKHRAEIIKNMPLFTDKLNEYSWLHAHIHFLSIRPSVPMTNVPPKARYYLNPQDQVTAEKPTHNAATARCTRDRDVCDRCVNI